MTPKDHSALDPASGRRNWGALAFAGVLAAAVLIFAWTVVSEARRTTDWLLIAPGAIITALAFLWAGVTDFRTKEKMTALAETARGEAARPVILIGLTCAFALAVPFVGFDLGTAVFILLCLLIQGERTWWKLALASIGGAALMTWTFTELLMVRLPVLFL